MLSFLFSLGSGGGHTESEGFLSLSAPTAAMASALHYPQSAVSLSTLLILYSSMYKTRNVNVHVCNVYACAHAYFWKNKWFVFWRNVIAFV